MANRGHKDGVNVQVILRCRPFSKLEQGRVDANRQFVLCKEDAKEVLVSQNMGGGKQLERSFHFDKVFGPDSGQERLYNQAVSPIVEEVLEGFNCTIFAYGQTGTGKTYTMEGGDRDSADGHDLSEVAGVIPRAIHQIFTTLDGNDSEYTVKCSFLELYNEETTDLLAVGDRQDQKLRIMEDRSGVVIQGLEEFIVKSSVDIFALLDRGSAKRRTAETQLNKQSSRSHSVFCITVHMREIAADGEEVIKIGKLYLVDLAGSENVSRSGAAGTVAKEAGSINKSLLTLGRVITALVEASGHIPYRDSKLTRLLRDSLGGKTKTCIIATIAPTTHCQDETLSTLDYAHRAKNIRNRPEVNQKISKTAHIKELNAEIDRLKAELFATREKNGVYLPADQFEQREESSKATQAKLEALEAEMEHTAAKHKTQTDKLMQRMTNLQQELAEATHAYEQAKLGIQERDFLILAHNRSEAAILAQSAALTNELNTADQKIAELYSRLQNATAREQRNADVITQLQQSSASHFSAMQTTFGSAVSSTEGFLQQSGTQLQSLMQLRHQEAEKVQKCLADLRGNLSTISSTASRGQHDLKTAIQEALGAIMQSEDSFVNSAMEASRSTSALAEKAFQTMAETQQKQKELLEATAQEQRAFTSALISCVQDSTNQGSSAVQQLLEGSNKCRSIAEGAFGSHLKAFTSFKSDFVCRMAEEKEILMQQIGQLISNFATDQSEQVENALTGFSSESQTALLEVGTASELVQKSAANSQRRLKDAEAQACEERNRRSEKQDEQQTELQALLTSSQMHCNVLQTELKQGTAGLMQKLQDHKEQMGKQAGYCSDSIAIDAEQNSQACVAAVSLAEERCNALGSECERDHATAEAAITEMKDVSNRAATHVTDSSANHLAGLDNLARSIDSTVNETIERDPNLGMLPERGSLELPPAQWLEQMRTPPAEILLAEFRQQQGHAVEAQPDESGHVLMDSNEQKSAVIRGPQKLGETEIKTEPRNAGSENTDPRASAEIAMQAVKSRIPGVKDRQGNEDIPRAAEAGRARKRHRA